MADSKLVRRHSGWIFALALGLGATGCTFDLADEGSEYREALPEADTIAVPGPGDANGTQKTAAAAPERGLMGTGDPATTTAFWYGFTRNVRDGVNQVTAGVLGSVWYLVNTHPTSVGDGTATWGPYTDALEPVTWRFRVTRIAPMHYRYILDGRPKTSQSDADYRVVLDGDGWGRMSEHHGDGTFTLDLDAAKALDPMKHPNDSGTVTIEHDLPRDIGENAFALPRTITADLRPSASPEWLTTTSTANQDGTGRLDIDGHVDTDASHATLIEDVGIVSRWRADGAGRADIVLSGGDVPSSYGSVTASECWGTDFTRVYYGDSASFAPTEGSESACAYDAAQ